MNVLFISIDSLRYDFLKSYGQTVDIPVQTPNLDRFAQRALRFDTHYAGSLPCMPARREFFAGIQEFLWRPWGPMEPFDLPVARAARREGAVAQLVTDHYHYFQHGSHGYYTDYNGFEFIRGHESDAWQTAPREPDPNFLRQLKAGNPNDDTYQVRAPYARNVASFNFADERDFFPAKVFSRAATWIDANRDEPKWFLAIDSFDVHEPFHCPEPYASMYTDENPRDPELVLWPIYGRIDEGPSQLSPRQVAFVRSQFAGKITMVDRWLGEVLAALDRQQLWDSTMVIVTADHGHFLGEHGWMGKPDAPLYDVLARTPLLIWHPANPRPGGNVAALTSAVDLYATMLEALEAAIPPTVHSRSLLPLVRGERTEHRAWNLYGYWGSTINVTDGRYTYFQPCPAGAPVNVYSTMMMQPWDWFDPAPSSIAATAGHFLPYTEAPVWRYAAVSHTRNREPMLFDTVNDPGQTENLAGQRRPDETRMRELLIEAMRQLDAPAEQFERLGLTGR